MPTVRIQPKPASLIACSRRFLPASRKRKSRWFRSRSPKLQGRLCRFATGSILLPFLVCGVVALLSTGCSSSRLIGDTALGAGGAVIGNQLSHGSPAVTAMGAAGGVLLSEGVHSVAKKESQKAYASGYDKGRSDAVKQQYWLQVSLQREAPNHVRLYPVQLPEQVIDGVTFQPTTKYLRIEE